VRAALKSAAILALAAGAWALTAADHREAEGHRSAALTHARREEWDAAFREIRAALNIEPRNPAYLYNLGIFYYNTQSYGQAVATLRDAHEFQPALIEYHRALASALEAAGMLELAEREYSALLARHPREAPAWSGRAAVELRRAKFQAARRDADRAIALDAKLAEAYYLRGKTSEQEGKIEEALADYRHVLSLEPAHFNANYRLIVVYQRLGRVEDSRRQAAIVRSLKSQLDASNAILFGTRSLSSGDYVSAAEQFTRAVDLRPKDTRALYYLGLSLQNQGRLEGAVDAYRQALAVNSDLAIVHAALGLILASRRETDAAHSHLARALELGDSDSPVNITAGRGLVVLREIGAAERAFLRALELSPGDPAALAELFQLYAMEERNEPARRYAILAADANPGDARLLYRVGLFWSAAGDFDRARQVINRAASLAPGDQQIQGLLAQIPPSNRTR